MIDASQIDPQLLDAIQQQLTAQPQAQPVPAAAPTIAQPSGLGGLLQRIGLKGLGQGVSNFGSAFRNTIAPIDPSTGVDPQYAQAQQRLAGLRLAAGIASGKGLGQGLAQGLDASSNQYQSAMENAYTNNIKKKQLENQQAAFANTLAQQKLQHDQWQAGHDIALQHLKIAQEEAAKPKVEIKSEPLASDASKMQDFMINKETGEKKPIGNPYTAPSQALNPTSVETTAQMIASGKMPMLTGMALKTPWGQAVVDRVGQINPDYQAGTQPQIAKAMRDFSTGAQGNAVRSLNVSIEHLDTLGELSDALHNGNVTLINKAGNKFAEQTGVAAPKNFDAAKQIVAGEIVKAVTASGGGVTDRQEAQHQIDAASSPAQLKGVIDTYQKLLAGQLVGLKHQYETATGMNDFEKKLSPKVIAKLQPLAAAAENPPPSDSSGWSIKPVQ